MPIERRRKPRAARMAQRGFLRASAGRMPERASGEMAWAWPRACARKAPLWHIPQDLELFGPAHHQEHLVLEQLPPAVGKHVELA
jgi:hypothetical protein